MGYYHIANWGVGGEPAHNSSSFSYISFFGTIGLVLLVPLLTIRLPVQQDSFNWSRCFQYCWRGCRARSTGPAASNTAVGSAVHDLLVQLLATRLPAQQDTLYCTRFFQYSCWCYRTRSTTGPTVSNTTAGAVVLVQPVLLLAI